MVKVTQPEELVFFILNKNSTLAWKQATAAKKELDITPASTCLFDESALLFSFSIDFDECFILAAVHVGSSFSLSSRSFGRR